MCCPRPPAPPNRHSTATTPTRCPPRQVRYWKTNLELVKSVGAHREAVRMLAFAPSDLKFATGSDDSTIRVRMWVCLWVCGRAGREGRNARCRGAVRGGAGLAGGRQLPAARHSCSTHAGACLTCEPPSLPRTAAQVWDFARVQTEQVLAGHGGDVKSVDWHPAKGLLVSGAQQRDLGGRETGLRGCGHRCCVQALQPLLVRHAAQAGTLHAVAH